MNLWVVPSCSDYVALDFLNEFAFRVPLLWKWRGNRDLYLLSGMIFTPAPGWTLTNSDLQPCMVTSCNVVWNDLWPSGAKSVYNWPSSTWNWSIDKISGWPCIYMALGCTCHILEICCGSLARGFYCCCYLCCWDFCRVVFLCSEIYGILCCLIW